MFQKSFDPDNPRIFYLKVTSSELDDTDLTGIQVFDRAQDLADRIAAGRGCTAKFKSLKSNLHGTVTFKYKFEPKEEISYNQAEIPGILHGPDTYEPDPIPNRLSPVWDLVIEKMAKFLYELKESFKPFPDPGSWSYQLQTRLYDMRVGKTAESIDFSIEPSEEAVADGTNTDDVLDIPAYIRRNKSVVPGATSGEGPVGDTNADAPKPDL